MKTTNANAWSDSDYTVAASQVSIFSALVSYVLWMNGVPQLQSWAGFFPAIALISALFAIVTWIRWKRDVPARSGITFCVSLSSATWALAIAAGI